MAFRKPVNADAAFTTGQVLQAADSSSDATTIPAGTGSQVLTSEGASAADWTTRASGVIINHAILGGL